MPDPRHDWPAGHRLFAQYAHAPNALGYCGPTGSATLIAAATGSPPVAAVSVGRETTVEEIDIARRVPAVARRFSGAWPYQRLIADITGIEDALDPDIVRGYWTGNDLVAGIDRREFGARLIDEFASQAGHYWAHLTAELLPEAAPTHAFHVLGVYPWSRLLGVGPEPLHVLESCRIGWARVTRVDADTLTVRGPQLAYLPADDDASARLVLVDGRERQIGYRLTEGPFVADWAVGDVAAVHWDFACDRLTEPQVQALVEQTEWQLAAMAPRVAGEAG